MNGLSNNPSDAAAIRRLVEESGVEPTEELTDALLSMRDSSRVPAPAPCAELEALFTAGVTPLRKPARRRGFLLGGAVIAAMAAGTTGVAATNNGFWVTAETSHEAPAPVTFEEIPAPTPAPAPAVPAAPAVPPAPAALPAPAAPVDVPVPVPEESAAQPPEIPAPATDEARPESGGRQGWQNGNSGDRGHGAGGGDRREQSWHHDDDDDDDYRGPGRTDQGRNSPGPGEHGGRGQGGGWRD